MSKKSGIEKTCPACGALFYVQAYRAAEAKFCSMKCLWVGRPKRVRQKVDCICRQCQKPYSVDAHRKDKTSFCSFSCSAKFNAPKREIARQKALLASPGCKICTKCNTEKPITEFYKHSSGYDGFRSDCILCFNKAQTERVAANPEKKREADRRYHAENAEEANRAFREKYADDPEPIRARNRKWREENPDKVRESNVRKREKHGDKLRANRRQDYRENKARYKAAAVARMKHIKQATPPWADMEKIAWFYAEAERLTKETGIPHHVDHIYPLRGKTMCGLHVEGNLQILHAVVNLRKSNKVGIGLQLNPESAHG